MPKNYQWNEHDLFCKTVLDFFKDNPPFKRSAPFYMRTAETETQLF